MASPITAKDSSIIGTNGFNRSERLDVVLA